MLGILEIMLAFSVAGSPGERGDACSSYVGVVALTRGFGGICLQAQAPPAKAPPLMSDQPTVPAEPVKKSRFTLPSHTRSSFALIVLAGAIATWMIPAGTYNLNDAATDTRDIPRGGVAWRASRGLLTAPTNTGSRSWNGLLRGDRGRVRVTGVGFVFDEAENRLQPRIKAVMSLGS